MNPFQGNGKHAMSPPQNEGPVSKKSNLEIPTHPNRFELPPSPSTVVPPPPPTSPKVTNTWDQLSRFESAISNARDSFRILGNNPEVKNNPIFALVSSLFPVFDELENVLNCLTNDQSNNAARLEKASSALIETEKTLENSRISQSILNEKNVLSAELKNSSFTVKVPNFPLPPNIKSEVEIFNAIENKIKSMGNDPSLISINPLKLKIVDDKLPVCFQCRDYHSKLRLENSLRKNQIETSYHWPSSLFGVIGKIRIEYKNAQLDNFLPPHEQLVKIRPSHQCHKILVLFKCSLAVPPTLAPRNGFLLIPFLSQFQPKLLDPSLTHALLAKLM